jgi:hypothetical protein
MESEVQNPKPVLSKAEGSKIPAAAPRIDLRDKVTGGAQYNGKRPVLFFILLGDIELSNLEH